jgi:hypothetical protein
MVNFAITREMGALVKEGGESMLNLCSVPPEDRRFLSQLLIELSQRNWAGDAAAAHQQIIEVTTEIAPERLHWVAHRLGLSGQPTPRSGDLP